MTLRSLLYLTPYFPPDPRVGALRPLKFVRHLPQLGYRPVVLADATSGRRDERLLAAIPDEAVVVRDYAFGTRRRARRATVARGGSQSWLSGLTRPLERWLGEYLARPELVPLGAHALDVPHAWRAADRLIDEYDCRAVLVNADPFAAAVVGALLARRRRLPLIADFRDPWALCHLRRPLRKPWVRSSTDRLERFVIQNASRVILNTEATRSDYAEHYADLPADRFVCVPNHADPTLHTEKEPEPAWSTARFTLLFLGNLRPFVEGETLLALLSVLRARGLGAAELCLKIVGSAPASFLGEAASRGLAEYVTLEGPVSYLDVPREQQRSNLLVILTHRGQQRIPAKIYDAALSDRPLLVISENKELEKLCQRLGGARVFETTELEPMADHVLSLYESERPGRITRDYDWNSLSASRRLAALLHEAGA